MVGVSKVVNLDNKNKLNPLTRIDKPYDDKDIIDLHRVARNTLFKDSNNKQDHIFIKQDKRLVKVFYDQILYCEKVGDYISISTESAKYLVLQGINSLIDRLDHEHFIKVHRSFIVNKEKIEDIEDHSMRIGSKLIPISRALKSEVLGKMNIL